MSESEVITAALRTKLKMLTERKYFLTATSVVTQEYATIPEETWEDQEIKLGHKPCEIAPGVMAWVVETISFNDHVTTIMMEIAPGAVAEKHIHRNWAETYHVVYGRLKMNVGETEFYLSSGSSFSVRKGEVHSWEAMYPTLVVVSAIPPIESRVEMARG